MWFSFMEVIFYAFFMFINAVFALCLHFDYITVNRGLIK
ncbi:hypothetical protein F652_3144 [Enterobacteriaceae bacterium bta3-1]|nr:hypothetical protein F652_3144 [Enterobacteriaceae bacterium bta3-1]